MQVIIPIVTYYMFSLFTCIYVFFCVVLCIMCVLSGPHLKTAIIAE